MPANISITGTEILTKVGNYLVELTGAEVIRMQSNRTPMPFGAFIAMTPLFMNRLSTNRHDINVETETITTTEAIKYTLQFDCFGENSSDWANLISLTWRDDYACNALAPECQPLTCSDPKQVPLITGEQQYMKRWIVTASLQYNPSITTDKTPFADQITFSLTPLLASINQEIIYANYFGVYALEDTGDTTELGAAFDIIDNPSTYLPLPSPHIASMTQ